MVGFNHLVLVKFKEDSNVEDVLRGVEKLVTELDIIKSFVWGEDIESDEMLRQGFTHAFMITFESKDDFLVFANHPNRVLFLSKFTNAIEKKVFLDFPAVGIKPTAECLR